jgi:hypothetical protein
MRVCYGCGVLLADCTTSDTVHLCNKCKYAARICVAPDPKDQTIAALAEENRRLREALGDIGEYCYRVKDHDKYCACDRCVINRIARNDTDIIPVELSVVDDVDTDKDQTIAEWYTHVAMGHLRKAADTVLQGAVTTGRPGKPRKGGKKKGGHHKEDPESRTSIDGPRDF